MPSGRREVAGAEDQRLGARARRRDLLDRHEAARALDLQLEPDAASSPSSPSSCDKKRVDEVDV